MNLVQFNASLAKNDEITETRNKNVSQQESWKYV